MWVSSKVNQKLFGQSFLVFVVSFLLTIWGAVRFNLFKKFFFSETVPAYSNDEFRSLVGQNAIVHRKLHPSGKVRIGEKIYDALALQGIVLEGKEVEVVDLSGIQLVVKEIQ